MSVAGVARQLSELEHTVHRLHLAWSRDGTWEKIADRLRQMVREREGRAPDPSAGAIDARSVRGASTVTGVTRGYEALRISRWGDRVDERPVGSAGVEQSADPVVGEPAEPERGPLHSLDQIVDRYLEGLASGPVGVGLLRRGHVVDGGCGEPSGALLTEAPGDFFA